jgi:hypothetical protein
MIRRGPSRFKKLGGLFDAFPSYAALAFTLNRLRQGASGADFQRHCGPERRSVAVRDSNYRSTKLVRRPLGAKPAAKGDT